VPYTQLPRRQGLCGGGGCVGGGGLGGGGWGGGGGGGWWGGVGLGFCFFQVEEEKEKEEEDEVTPGRKVNLKGAKGGRMVGFGFFMPNSGKKILREKCILVG